MNPLLLIVRGLRSILSLTNTPSVRNKAPRAAPVCWRLCGKEPKPIPTSLSSGRFLQSIPSGNWDDCKAGVKGIPLTIPGGFSLSNQLIAGDQTEITFDVNVDQGRPAGRYSFSVVGQCQVPFNKDPAAIDRPNNLVSMPRPPLTLTVVTPPK